jgi:DNA-binding protein
MKAGNDTASLHRTVRLFLHYTERYKRLASLDRQSLTNLPGKEDSEIVTEKKQKERNSTPKTPKTGQTSNNKDNIVFVGKKPVMNYVTACLTCFNTGAGKVTVKARGMSITRAVDTVELLRRAFLKDLKLGDITVCTEEVEREEGRKSRVSAIEMTLTKP